MSNEKESPPPARHAGPATVLAGLFLWSENEWRPHLSLAVLVPRQCRHAAVTQEGYAAHARVALILGRADLCRVVATRAPAFSLALRPKKRRLRKPRSPARGNGAVQRARMIVPVTRATIVLIEVWSCARALWTRPKPTTSVMQANASITTLRCVRRLAASSEKLFKTCSPEGFPLISRGEWAEGSRRAPRLWWPLPPAV